MRQAWPAALLMLLQPATIANAADLAVLYGSWDPGGSAFEGEGLLTVTDKSIDWGGCRGIPYRVASDRQLETYLGDWLHRSPKTGLTWRVIALELLDGGCIDKFMPGTGYLQFAIPSDMPAHADIVFYASPEGLAEGVFSWGVFGRAQ